MASIKAPIGTISIIIGVFISVNVSLPISVLAFSIIPNLNGAGLASFILMGLAVFIGTAISGALSKAKITGAAILGATVGSLSAFIFAFFFAFGSFGGPPSFTGFLLTFIEYAVLDSICGAMGSVIGAHYINRKHL